MIFHNYKVCSHHNQLITKFYSINSKTILINLLFFHTFIFIKINIYSKQLFKENKKIQQNFYESPLKTENIYKNHFIKFSLLKYIPI